VCFRRCPCKLWQGHCCFRVFLVEYCNEKSYGKFSLITYETIDNRGKICYHGFYKQFTTEKSPTVSNAAADGACDGDFNKPKQERDSEGHEEKSYSHGFNRYHAAFGVAGVRLGC